MIPNTDGILSPFVEKGWASIVRSQVAGLDTTILAEGGHDS